MKESIGDLVNEKQSLPDSFEIEYYPGFKANTEIIFANFFSLGLQNEYSKNGFNLYLTIGLHMYGV